MKEIVFKSFIILLYFAKFAKLRALYIIMCYSKIFEIKSQAFKLLKGNNKRLCGNKVYQTTTKAIVSMARYVIFTSKLLEIY